MDTEQRRTSAARSRIIGRVYAQWAVEQAGQFTPDPRYADDPAYSEHAPLISASPQAQDELHRRTTEALTAAGLAFGRDNHVRRARLAQEVREDGHHA